MPLMLFDDLQHTEANGPDIRHLWAGNSTRVLLLHTMHAQLVAGSSAARAATFTHSGHFSFLDRPREVAQLIHEAA